MVTATASDGELVDSQTFSWTVTNVPDPPSFTDDPLTTGVSAVKARHITELRQAIDELRARAALGSFGWTDASIVPGVTEVKAVHLTELRTALNAVYAAAAQSPPTYAHTIVTGGATIITAEDITELRAAVVSIW
jgi:hypothetical protein